VIFEFRKFFNLSDHFFIFQKNTKNKVGIRCENLTKVVLLKDLF